MCFHTVEEVTKRLIHRADVEKASREIRYEELGARAVVVFCVFVRLFIFLEIRRVMGDEAFKSLLFAKPSRETGGCNNNQAFENHRRSVWVFGHVVQC